MSSHEYSPEDNQQAIHQDNQMAKNVENHKNILKDDYER